MAKPKMDFMVDKVFGQLLHVYSADLEKAMSIINKTEGVGYVSVEKGKGYIMAMINPLYDVDEVKEEILELLSIAYIPDVFKENE